MNFSKYRLYTCVGLHGSGSLNKVLDYKQLDKINEHKFIYSPEEYEQAKTKSYHTINQYGKLSIPENTENYYYYSFNNTPTEILGLIELIKNNFSEY